MNSNINTLKGSCIIIHQRTGKLIIAQHQSFHVGQICNLLWDTENMNCMTDIYNHDARDSTLVPCKT